MLFEMNLLESTMYCHTTIPNNYVRNLVVLMKAIIYPPKYCHKDQKSNFHVSSIKLNKTCHYDILVVNEQYESRMNRNAIKSDIYGHQKQIECYYTICLCIESCQSYCHYQKRLFLSEYNREW